MTPKVPRYQSEQTQIQGIMRTINVVQRQRDRIERLEELLYRALQGLDISYHTLRIDIKEALDQKRGRVGPKSPGRGACHPLEEAK